MTRSIIKELGSRGNRRCLVVREGTGRYLVERYVHGRPRRKTFADRASAIAWAKTWYEAGLPSMQDLTLRQLLDRWMATESEKKNWRAATWTNYRNHRKRIEEVLGPDTRANGIGHADLDELWLRLTRLPMATNQVAQKVRMLQRVYAWAHARDFVNHNKLATWDIPEVTKLEPGEYAPDDIDRILAAWDKEDGWQWRPWAVTMLAQSHGIRIKALLNLRWSDIDLDAGTITMRAEVDKTKDRWERPLSWDGLSALLTARWHRDRLEGQWERRGLAVRAEHDWVFYGKGDKPYTYGGYWEALQKAERKAGVKHERYRAAHGWRRTAVGNVRRQTGDMALALLWVNHRNLKDAGAYVKGREEEFQQLADGQGGESPADRPADK